MRLQIVLCAMAVSAMAASPVTYWSNQNGSGEIGMKAHVFWRPKASARWPPPP